jgi:two-component system response regulator AtoC
MEAKLIRKALGKTNGNKSRAAKLLEISYPALLTKIGEYSIEIAE